MNIKPYVTEKTTAKAKDGVFTFIVDRAGNKITVANALEKLHNVSVLDITSISAKPTTRVFRGHKGAKKSFKKMMVTLKKGQTIPGFEIVDDKQESKKEEKTKVAK